MFGIGVSELVLIAIVALVVVGPKRLPGTLRAIGRAIGEFRRAMGELRNEVGFDNVVDEVTRPLREGMSELSKEVRDATHVEDIDVMGTGAEYPAGGPDDYGALPEDAMVYPDVAPVYPPATVKALEGTVARGTVMAEDDGHEGTS